MRTKVIFLGGIWNKENETWIINNSRGYVQIAANVLQTALIDGLDSNLETPVTVLSEKFIGSFPFRYKRLFIKKSVFNHSTDKNHTDYNIEFINAPGLKHYSRYISSKKYLRAVCNDTSVDRIYVIAYSMTYSIVEGLLYAKGLDHRVRTCLIVPDLPEYMNLGKKKSVLFNLAKSLMSKKLYKDIKEIDAFVTLTKYIYEALEVKKPYTVVEGIATCKSGCGTISGLCETKSFVYTGTLDIKYGVGDLVDAFTKIEDTDIQLLICGAGDGIEHINSVSKNDKRIKYLGTVSNEEARRIQNEAYVLINPRNSNEEYTKFSFPSKTMEYMVTGRPVLMYKLKGIPDEYDDYLYYIDGDMEKALRNLLTLSEKELNHKGKKARKFVLENKNPNKQAEKIIKMMNSLE